MNFNNIQNSWIINEGEYDFSTLRNKALDSISINPDYIYWIDGDEVAFPEELKRLKYILDGYAGVSEVCQEMVHFMISPDQYQDVIRKNNMFRYNKNLRWDKSVHECLINKTEGEVLNLNTKYLHFGYCRHQVMRFIRWLQYAYLEHGNVNCYRENIENIDGKDKVVDYLRDWRTPNTILQDRIPLCKPYKDEYPASCDSWLKEWKDSGLLWEEYIYKFDPEISKLWNEWQELYKKHGSWKDTLRDICKMQGWKENF